MNEIAIQFILVAQGLPKVDFNATFTNVLRLAFVFIALLSTLFIVIGGFQYVTSAGDPQGLQKAKNTILCAIVGLALGLSASLVVTFVLGRLL